MQAPKNDEVVAFMKLGSTNKLEQRTERERGLHLGVEKSSVLPSGKHDETKLCQCNMDVDARAARVEST